MKKKKRIKPDFYEDDAPANEDFPVGELKRVPDFLPPPEELAKAPIRVRVTIELDAESIEFFQQQALKHKTKYQRMIREVLKRYVKHFKAA